MKILLLLLGLCFFFIFYFFYNKTDVESSFFYNIFLEANLYVFVAFALIFYIWTQENVSSHELDEENQEDKISFFHIFDDFSFKIFVMNIFEKYIYIIAIILFYISSSLFLHVFFENIKIEWIFMFFNILVLSLYFLEEKFQVFQDFLRVNTSVISLYYILFHIFYIFSSSLQFSYVDMVNIAIVWLLFYIFLQSTRWKKYKAEFYSYILIFLLLEIMVFCKYVFGEVYYVLLLLSALFSFVFLIYTSEISQKINLPKKYIRIWGLFLSYIFIIFSSKYLLVHEIWWLIITPILLSSTYILYMFHRIFQNYISLFFSLFSGLIFSLIIYWYMFSDMYTQYIGIYLLCFSGLYLIIYQCIESTQKWDTAYDSYFFHVFSFIVNLVWCLLFVVFRDISILSLSLLLMGESIYLFYSYYTLPKQNN